MSRERFYLFLLGALLLFIFARFLTLKPGRESGLIHHPAPDIALPVEAVGPPLHLSKLQGKVVALDFWATWCGPCRQSIPELARLYQKYHAQGLEVIGISEDRPESRGLVPQSKKELGITYPIVFADDIPGISDDYPHDGLPTLYIIDRKGNLVNVMVGLHTNFDLEAALVALLKESP